MLGWLGLFELHGPEGQGPLTDIRLAGLLIRLAGLLLRFAGLPGFVGLLGRLCIRLAGRV